uniref:translocator protein-like n=1 Tax=Myxine glutinosa TaxID=7769 RepID=UPI00358F1142
LPHIGILETFVFRQEFKNWYNNLNKPAWCPPKLLFKLAWPILYTGMGVGSYLIWKELGGFTNEAVVPLGLYATQLALNWLWTPIFFWSHKMGWAFADILLLDSAIAATIFSWYSINKTAAGLLLPYLGWMCLATALNYRIWQDNKEKCFSLQQQMTLQL